jgi:hypothetical protein
MEFEDVVNELMDSLSEEEDDDDEVYIVAAHIVVSDIVNPACHRGSVEGHRVLNRDRQWKTKMTHEIQQKYKKLACQEVI